MLGDVSILVTVKIACSVCGKERKGNSGKAQWLKEHGNLCKNGVSEHKD